MTGGRPLSEIRMRTRDALRALESQSTRPIDGEELTRLARVPQELIAHYVRLDFVAGIRHMEKVLPNIVWDGREPEDIFNSAVAQNPWPMWVNVSADFRDPVLGHCTVKRYKTDLARFDKKNRSARTHKRSDVQNMIAACPALAKVLESSNRALKGVGSSPAQIEGG